VQLVVLAVVRKGMRRESVVLGPLGKATMAETLLELGMAQVAVVVVHSHLEIHHQAILVLLV
jgi:hypothetical protein